jgi:hypothetical protein
VEAILSLRKMFYAESTSEHPEMRHAYILAAHTSQELFSRTFLENVIKLAAD